MRWSFLLKPRWVVGHVIIVALSVLMLSLSNWQWHRLHERITTNNQVRAAIAASPLTITTSSIPPDAKAFRSASITGTPLPELTAYVRYPIQNGRSGYFVVVPYRLSDGSMIAVTQGWVPVDDGKDDTRPAPLQTAPFVTTQGILRSFESPSGQVGHTTGGMPTLPALARTQLAELFDIDPDKLASMWIQQQLPKPEAPLELLPGPDLSKGPHRSYALQWIAFTLIIVVGYGILLWRTTRDEP